MTENMHEYIGLAWFFDDEECDINVGELWITEFGHDGDPLSGPMFEGYDGYIRRNSLWERHMTQAEELGGCVDMDIDYSLPPIYMRFGSQMYRINTLTGYWSLFTPYDISEPHEISNMVAWDYASDRIPVPHDK